MKKVYLVFLVLYNCCLSFSQINKIDSVYKALQNKKIDSLYIKSHINLCIYYSKTDLKDSAFYHGWLANKTSIEEKYEFGVLKSYQELGLLYFGVGEYDSTIYCFKNVLLKLKNKQSVFYFEATNTIGNSYFYLGDYINAYDYYLKYLRQAQNSGTTKQLAKGNSNVGVILKEQKKYEEALVFFNKTIKIGVENKDNQILFVGYSNKGNIYNEKAKLDTNTKWNLLALENYNKAKSALRFLKKSDFRNSILLLGNIGNVYADLGNYKKSIEEFNEAIVLVESNEFFPQSASIYNNVSEVYLDLGNLKMAQKYIKIATDISIESQAYDNLSQSYQNYSRFYELKGDYLNAFKAYKLYKAYNDSTFNTENTEKLKELELKGEFEKKESIKLAEQEKKDALALEEKNKQRIIILSITIILVMVAFLAFFIFKGLKTQRKANKIISLQKLEVERQKHIVEEHQKETLDSIHYAKRIQTALLANQEFIDSHLSQNFILFKPKDIVSGDFYWATEHNNKFYLAVCDCTGHGVPGAFMSLLNIGFLSEAIKEKSITDPGEIFNYVRNRLISSISSDGQQDGMDGVLLCIDKTTNEITYSAANNESIFSPLPTGILSFGSSSI